MASPPGWALYFLEGWDWRKILIGTYLAFTITEIVIVSLIYHFEHRLQDVFAMASFLLDCFVAGVAVFQAWLNMKIVVWYDAKSSSAKTTSP
jgi:hypothetical protein